MGIRGTSAPKVSVPPVVEENQTPVEETVVETKPQEKAPEAKPAEKKSAPPPAVKESAGLPDLKLVRAPSLMELKEAMDPVEYGNVFKRVVGGNGEILTQDKVSLGKWANIQVLSWHDHRYMLTPSIDANGQKVSASDAKSRKFCRASYDGLTIIDGESGQAVDIEDYKEQSKAAYIEWNLAKYMDIFGLVFACEKNVEAARNIGIIQISISPTAMKEFKAYMKQMPLTVARGLAKASHQNCFKLTAEGKIGDNGNYTIFIPANIPEKELEGYTPIYEG